MRVNGKFYSTIVSHLSRLTVSASSTLSQLLQFLTLKWQLKSSDMEQCISLYHQYSKCNSKRCSPSPSPRDCQTRDDGEQSTEAEWTAGSEKAPENTPMNQTEYTPCLSPLPEVECEGVEAVGNSEESNGSDGTLPNGGVQDKQGPRETVPGRAKSADDVQGKAEGSLSMDSEMSPHSKIQSAPSVDCDQPSSTLEDRSVAPVGSGSAAAIHTSLLEPTALTCRQLESKGACANHCADRSCAAEEGDSEDPCPLGDDWEAESQFGAAAMKLSASLHSSLNDIHYKVCIRFPYYL